MATGDGHEWAPESPSDCPAEEEGAGALARLRQELERWQAIAASLGDHARALGLREERLAEVQRLARVGHWELDIGSGRVSASAEAFRIYGWPPDQGNVDRSYLLHAIHPDDRERTRAALWRAVREHATFDEFHRIVRPNGEVRYVHSRGRVTEGPEGAVVIGTVQDVTEAHLAAEEREHLVQELSAERRWLGTLIERLPVAVLLVGTDGAIRANEQAQRLLGNVPARSDPNSLLMELCDAQGNPIPYERMPLIRALRGEFVKAEELHFRRPDGGLAVAVASAGPICDEQGQRLGTVAVLEDITRLKELERMREEWTSVVAHDLRQPVTVIHAQAQLLSRHPDFPPQVATRIDHILAAARQLDRMIGDLLDVTRIETRRLALDLQPIDLESFAVAVVERNAEILAGHEVRLRVNGAVPPVRADPMRAEQILANLLSNAARYGDEGAPIEIEIERARERALVRVINRGPGIAPEEMSSLFQRFYRTPAGRARFARGMGLGLYITRGLVEAHGGTIFASSIPGDRTTFSFTLPLAHGSGRPAKSAH